MRTIIVAMALCCLSVSVARAQDFLNLVPSTATLVIKYSGENFSKAMPLQKLDSYGFIKDDFFKVLRIDTLTSLQNIGLDLSRDFYQYLSMDDTCMSFVTLLNIKNEAQFVKLIKANYGSSKKISKKKGVSFMPVSETSYVGWNKTRAIIVNTTYQNRKSYYSRYYEDYGTSDTTMVVVPVPDTAVTIVEELIVDTSVVMEMDTTVVVVDSIAVIDEEKIEDERISILADSLNNLKWELWEQQQDMIARKQQQVAAEKIINRSLAGNIYSIKNDANYAKIIDPAAHISVWMNTENLFSQYTNYFNKGSYYPWSGLMNSRTDTSTGFQNAFNMYFEKEKLRVEQKSFSADPKMNNLMLNVMKSNQHSSLLNYVNPGNIGYFSMSINTEAMAHYYYLMMKNYLRNSSYMGEFTDLVDVYIDLVEIMIDEKGIADLFPGNYMFVMHDMKPQIVDYTDYEYDEEYNKKEVKKTKKEISPDFTFAMETRREDFLQKIVNLPLKYAEKGDYNYKQKEGYYELAFDTGKYPIKSLYFMVKGGKAIVTTSKEVINMTINNTGYTVDADTKNTILNNNYALSINTKRLLQKLETQLSTDVNKQITDYLLNNMGDLKMESKVKDGMIQGTTSLNIKGSHNNSLEFFFNMMDAINSIIEKEKQEKEKKLY